MIVGLQADQPLKRTCKPKGGYSVVKKALEAYGYEPGERLRVYETDVVTHNDLTFSIYTDEVSFRVWCLVICYTSMEVLKTPWTDTFCLHIYLR